MHIWKIGLVWSDALSFYTFLLFTLMTDDGVELHIVHRLPPLLTPPPTLAGTMNLLSCKFAAMNDLS
jgi:hypothetical protein